MTRESNGADKPPLSWEGVSLLGASPNSVAAPMATPAKPIFSMNFEENPRASNLVTGSVAVIDGHYVVHRLSALIATELARHGGPVG